MTKADADHTDRFDRLEQRLDKSFDRIDQRFERIDQKFDKVDERFEKIDQRFEEIDKKFEKVDQRLEKIDEQFEGVDQRFGQVDKQLSRLTAAMVKGFDRIDKELDKKADKVDLSRALDMLDSMIKRQEVDDQERLVMSHHIERIERWSHELAGKIGHKLSSA